MKKAIFAMLFTLSLSLALPSSYGYCSGISEQQTATQISVSVSDWKTLQDNNRMQKNLLMQLSSELTTAKEQLIASQTELNAVKTSLTASQNQTVQLQKELSEQKQQVRTLQQQLTELRTSAGNAKTSIEKANESLNAMNQELKKAQQEREKTEKKLRTQKTLWQILAIGLGVWGTTR